MHFFRNRCDGCGYWTVFRINARYFKAQEICTYCGRENTIPWNRKVQELISQNEKFLTDLEPICVELQRLKEPGDHVVLPLAGVKRHN